MASKLKAIIARSGLACTAKYPFLPDDVRVPAIKHAMADPWVREQMSRAARSVPTGGLQVWALAIRAS